MKSRRSKIVLALLIAVILSLLTASVWIWHESWHALPRASLTIDGMADRQAKVYLSRGAQEVLIAPDDVKESFLYIVSLPQKRIGVTYASDFDLRTKWFALPSERRPLRDWVPNESNDSTEPHLSISQRTIQFIDYSKHHLQVRY